jgi:general secretion pathway protein G
MKRLSVRRQGGFTLIEVLLVLVILVVLASFVVVNIGRVQSRSKMDQARAQIGMFKTPISVFQLNCGGYPSTLEALIQPPPDVPPGKWSGPYLESGLPADPWGNPYQYMCPGQHNPETYDCWTVSPEGLEIGNWEQ